MVNLLPSCVFPLVDSKRGAERFLSKKLRLKLSQRAFCTENSHLQFLDPVLCDPKLLSRNGGRDPGLLEDCLLPFDASLAVCLERNRTL